ncbi:helix-turn-helix domain-containing protein [Streptomyces vinaceus]
MPGGDAGRAGFALRYVRPLVEAARNGAAGHAEPLATQKRVAELLGERGCPVDPTNLSRYLNGKRRPERDFLRSLHELAIQRTGLVEPAGIAWSDLVEAFERVEWCKKCADRDDELAALRAENEEHARSLASLAGEVAGLRNLEKSVRRRAAHPPVPPSEGDRRGEASDVAAARNFAAATADLYSGGRPDEAVTALTDVVRFLTPGEAVAAMEFLHAGRHTQLEESLGKMVARERSARTVIEVAVGLKQSCMPRLADMILEAAAARGGRRK